VGLLEKSHDQLARGWGAHPRDWSEAGKNDNRLERIECCLWTRIILLVVLSTVKEVGARYSEHMRDSSLFPTC
jgi:hypothetical protein